VSAKVKYGVCISVGVLIELVGLLVVIGSAYNPGGGARLPQGCAFVFPYMSLAFLFKEPNALAAVVEFASLFQMPFYGWVLGRGWVRCRFWPEIAILGGSHFIVSMFGFIALGREVQ
jgi:uncharacterized membrane protein YkgB